MIGTTRSPEALAVWLADRRWFRGGDADAPVDVHLSSVALATDPPVAIGVADVALGDRYQLLLDGSDRPDRGEDPVSLAALAGFVARGGEASAEGAGTVRGAWMDGADPLGEGASRVFGAEQSNTSAVVCGHHVLKVLRRLRSGPHPELEIGRHLAAVADTHPAPVAPLSGWYELEAADATTTTTTLGVVQELVPGALDGWVLVLSGLAGDPSALLGRLHDLGTALARLHDALAQPARDRRRTSDTERAAPDAFGSVPLDADRVQRVVDGVVAESEHLLASALDRPPALAAVAGRAVDVADLAGRLATSLGDDLGASIRHHGDLHLGQTVVGPDGWVILDFEGEPNRPLEERRQRHSPLRDVAGMLRSLAYAAATHRHSDGVRLSDGWDRAARAAFLDGYLRAVDPGLIPASAAATSRLLALFELEKVVYEIGYELSHRPDWLALPVHGLTRLLQASPS